MAMEELTREQYKEMLKTARRKGKENDYLIAKTFALTGLPVQQLSCVTVESLQQESISFCYMGENLQTQIPDFLKKELAAYVHRKGLKSGPIFRDRQGKPVSRNTTAVRISWLGSASGLPDGSATPRNLIELYFQGMQESELEQEQKEIGWSMYRGES